MFPFIRKLYVDWHLLEYNKHENVTFPLIVVEIRPKQFLRVVSRSSNDRTPPVSYRWNPDASAYLLSILPDVPTRRTLQPKWI